ncbi:hypothetical protein DFJ63DRAFT_25232 [Scheffersomyces coipomensis]|uniref:uncharacterized protein n=1 Tax=Scheffersomyces coipomensis TaxID=1788519 RepID=UPI00315DADB2
MITIRHVGILRVPRLIPLRSSLQFRFKSDDSKKNNKDNKDLASKSDSNNDVSEFNIKPATSKSAPAPIDATNSGLDRLIKKNNKPYIPKLQHQRVAYEYPGLPNEDDFTKSQKPKLTTRWSRYIPKILTVIAAGWGVYAIKVWMYAPEKGAESKELLDPAEFHKFIVTHKEQIDNDHYLIELVPKFDHWKYSFHTNYEEKSLWNGDRIWSVDVKQPDIMVVRSYTPLPLLFMKSEYTRTGEKKPLLKVVENDSGDYDRNGVMCLYVKRYNDGEVSKYITNKEVGEELELRGPRIEYKFPYHPLKKFHTRPMFRDLPSKIESENLLDHIKTINDLPDFDNINFFAAGTGIAPILQVLLSRNPYRGFVNIHYSAQKPGELKPLERFMFFLEKLDRVKIHYHYDSDKKSILSKKDISPPTEPNYISPMRIEDETPNSESDNLKLRLDILQGQEKQDQKSNIITERAPRYENAIQQALITSNQPKKGASLSIVCGPEGYIDYVAGPKDLAQNEQGEVKGLLGNKKWDSKNVFKL